MSRPLAEIEEELVEARRLMEFWEHRGFHMWEYLSGLIPELEAERAAVLADGPVA